MFFSITNLMCDTATGRRVGCSPDRSDDDDQNQKPDCDNRQSIDQLPRFPILPKVFRLGSALLEDLSWNQLHRQGHHHGQDDQVVQIAQHRNEVGDEVDGGECICDCCPSADFCQQRGLFILQREIDGRNILFQLDRSFFQIHGCFPVIISYPLSAYNNPSEAVQVRCCKHTEKNILPFRDAGGVSNPTC